MLLQFYIVKEMLSTYTKVKETEYNLDDNKNVKKNLHIHNQVFNNKSKPIKYFKNVFFIIGVKRSFCYGTTVSLDLQVQVLRI